MDNQNPRPRATPKHRIVNGITGDEPGSGQTFEFNLRGIDENDRAQIAKTITRLMEEHNSPQKIIYTTLTGHTPDGRTFAEATLLPAGDAIRISLPGEQDTNELRCVATYTLAAYLALVYDIPLDEVSGMCDAADQDAERHRAEMNPS